LLQKHQPLKLNKEYSLNFSFASNKFGVEIEDDGIFLTNHKNIAGNQTLTLTKTNFVKPNNINANLLCI